MQNKDLIYIGTSGYSYGTFYPRGTYFQDRLIYYSDVLDTVEINTTFYNIPKDDLIIGWYDKTPKNFIFSVKVNRFFTHKKRLKIDKEFIKGWKIFYRKCKLLKEKLGPILFQFPYSLTYDTIIVRRLNNLSKILTKTKKYVFEFRNPSMFNPIIEKIMIKNNWSLCIFDMLGKVYPKLNSYIPTCKWGIYIRFHGTEGLYKGTYQEHFKKWMKYIKKMSNQEYEIYMYFNNTAYGVAFDDAIKFQVLVDNY